MPTEQTLAAELDRQHHQRQQFQAVTDDLDHAYRIQDALIALRMARGAGPIVGWKAGLTTKRMQEFCGVDQPIFGPILAAGMKPSPAELRASDFGRLGVESELALRVGADGIDAICAAFEIIDDRAADYSRLSAAGIAADGAWNSGIILGPPVAQFGSLNGLEGALSVNGAETGRGRSEDAGGDPRRIYDWVGAAIAARGREYVPGQWVSTGSIVTTWFAKPGDRLKFTLGDLPPVELAVS